ncbi:uncharacterized protein [Physcomitrium patens]|uniref:uncharacterized protein n=1 Tax=Physcomitrium patens TaxID=3218 RepID=UPI003CCE0313
MYLLLGFICKWIAWVCGGFGGDGEQHPSDTRNSLHTDSGDYPRSTDAAESDDVYNLGSSAAQLRPVQQQIKYDVFINHRGPDTKYSFVTFLQEGLEEKQYTPFVDKSLGEGKLVFEEIEAAIQATSVHLAIFSPRYAESEYCLDELVSMLKRRRKSPNGAVTLVPVFYKVKPQDLRTPDLPGSPFWQAFQKNKIRYSGRRISEWREALHDAADLKGFVFKKGEDGKELKNKIIDRVQELIAPRSREQQVPWPIVGGKVLLEGTLGLLEEMEDKVGILGICGIGGIGKTTLAQRVYNLYSTARGFTKHTFLKLEASQDMKLFQAQVLRDLLNKNEKNLDEEYVNHFEGLAGVKVLVVLDNICSVDHFKELVPNMLKLGGGSRIILTSRERDTMRAIMNVEPSCAFCPLDMKKLGHEDSFQLFWLHAFQNRDVSTAEGNVFRPLAAKVVKLCGGLPLALKVIGQHLYGKSEEVWSEASETLRDRPDIIDVLSISYKGLRDPDKMMFLDVSCQMVGLLEEDAIDIWKSCRSCPSLECMTSKMVHDSLQILKDKSLVEVDEDKRLTMHDLLREMGRKMDEVEKIGSLKREGHRCHLWDPSEAEKYLKEGKPTSFGVLAFQTMSEIHLMQLDGARIEGDFSVLSKKIRWLQWRSSFLRELPPRLDMKCLVILDLSNSDNLARLWSDDDEQAVPRLLRVLLLRNCRALKKLPKTIKLLTMLRTLNLQGCIKLKLLPGSLGDLQGLQDLNLNECRNLERLPEGIVKLSNLKALSMDFCRKIATLFPTDDGELGANLIKFSARRASSLTKLPESFSRLSLLEELWLSGCCSLSELPQSMKGLVKLRFIRIANSGLTHLPTDFGELRRLSELHITSCDELKSLPESFGKLEMLKILRLKHCTSFRTLSCNFGELPRLTELNLESCPIEDSDLPLSFGRLKSLTSLLMPDNKLTKLPNSFKNLTALAILDMRRSRDLANVDALPAFLEELELSGCRQLVCVDLQEKVKKLRKLSLYNCTRLTQLRGLESSECTALEKIDVYRCRSLSHLYEDQVSNSNLRECYLSGSGVCLPYNNDWSQISAPSCQVISYYDHAIGFVENTMMRKICSVRDANELCLETRISRKECGIVVEAVVITVIAHDKGFLAFFWGKCSVEGRILRSDVEVFTSELFSLRRRDHRDQAYICTLRRSHPLVERLQDGDRVCVFVRSSYDFEITVMKGSIFVAYNRPDQGLRSDVLGGLVLKDCVSNTRHTFRAEPFPLVRQALTLPLSDGRLKQIISDHDFSSYYDALSNSDGSFDTDDYFHFSASRAVFFPHNNLIASILSKWELVNSILYRKCDMCDTLFKGERGWHCNVCNDFDMCETCFKKSVTENGESPPPHQLDHSMSVFQSPNRPEFEPILMPYEKGIDYLNWGYVVYEYPNVRWCETFEFIR